MQTRNQVSTKKVAIAFVEQKLLISENGSFQLLRSLRWCLFASFFKASCKSISLNGVSPILFMSKRLRYLLPVCSTWQKPCSGKYIVGNPSNISFTILQSSGKSSLQLIQKFDHPCVKYNGGFILALDVDKTFLDGGIAFAYTS